MSSSSPTPSPAAAGGGDPAAPDPGGGGCWAPNPSEIAGQFKAGLTRLLGRQAVAYLAKTASSLLLPEEEAEGAAAGVTKEVVTFAWDAAMRPKLWLDFPLLDDDDDDMDYDAEDLCWVDTRKFADDEKKLVDAVNEMEYAPTTRTATGCSSAMSLGSSADKTVKFWDLKTFELIGSTGPEGVQALSGTGACRLFADFHKHFLPDSQIYIPTPTWSNHRNIWRDAQVPQRTFLYYHPELKGLDFAGLMDDIKIMESFYLPW